MKSEGEVRRKIQQAQYRHIKSALCSRFPPGEEWPKGAVRKIKGDYRDFFSTSPIHVIAKEYPDVAALMWVLQDQPDQPLVVKGSLVGRMGGVMLWADSDEEAAVARGLIDRLVEAATREADPEIHPTEEGSATLIKGDVRIVPSHTPDLPSVPPILKSWWQRLFV